MKKKIAPTRIDLNDLRFKEKIDRAFRGVPEIKSFSYRLRTTPRKGSISREIKHPYSDWFYRGYYDKNAELEYEFTIIGFHGQEVKSGKHVIQLSPLRTQGAQMERWAAIFRFEATRLWQRHFGWGHPYNNYRP